MLRAQPLGSVRTDLMRDQGAVAQTITVKLYSFSHVFTCSHTFGHVEMALRKPYARSTFPAVGRNDARGY